MIKNLLSTQVNKHGSAKSGTGHFIKQRITAIFMIPLALWFVFTVLMLAHTPITDLPWFITSPITIIGALLFIVNMMWHASLGLQMIIEDYIHCKALKYTALLLMFGFNVVITTAGLVSVFTIYILSRMI